MKVLNYNFCFQEEKEETNKISYPLVSNTFLDIARFKL